MDNGLDTDKPVLDHVVFNVRFDMDGAQAAFEALGYLLTPRGYHTLGSINHLMILDTDYLELIGLPAAGTDARVDIAAAPMGLNGLVFKTRDVDATFAHLGAVGMAGDPPKSFSRPVDVDGREEHARFRTVAVRGDVFPAGRVYFCEHGTPELVWRDAWRAHANGAATLAAFVIVTPDPAGEAARYGTLLGIEPGTDTAGRDIVDLNVAHLRFVTAADFTAHHGAASGPVTTGDTTFGALVVRCPDPATAAAIARDAGIEVAVQDTDDGVAVRSVAYNALVEYISGP